MLNKTGLKKFFVALVLLFLLLPVARFISPRAIVDQQALYLAYLPISLMVAMLMLFGRHAIAPLVIVFAISCSLRYSWMRSNSVRFCWPLSRRLSCAP